MSLESDSQSTKMQRMLELQLSNYQVMISEIEQKVHYLLESCEDTEDYQEQIDALSSKLEEVKLDLEGVQMMLEDRSLEEEGLDDEKETSGNETHLEGSREIQIDPRHKNAICDGPSSAQSFYHLVPPIEGHERSGSESPVSVDSIPLEWDHTADVGASFYYEDEDEGKYHSALSDVEITENPEAYLKMTTNTLKASSEAHPWCSPDSPVFRKHRYNQAEMVGNVLSGPETSTPYKPDYGSPTKMPLQVKQLSSASDTSINKEKNMSADMSDEEPRDERDLVTTGAADKQPGIIEGWEFIQAQDLRTKFRMKQKLQQWQQLNSDLSDISAWLDKTEQELKELQEVKPPTSMKALGQTVKKLKDMVKAFDNYKTVMLSINLSSKGFQKADSTEFQNKLQKMNLHWEKETCALDDWREGLQEALLHCKAFHDQTQNLILWLARAESRRNKAQITDPSADLSTVLECQRALMQLEKELMEQQLKVYSLEELTAYLLIKSDGEYIEAKELVHLIGRKLRHLIEQVSDDLKAIQGNLDTRECRLVPGDLGSRVYNPATTQSSPAVKKIRTKRTSVGRTSSSTRDESHLQPVQAVSRPPSSFRRVLRAALPFLMFILLLLLLACMVLFYVVAYSCTKANNFACSFPVTLQYTNRPPPF